MAELTRVIVDELSGGVGVDHRLATLVEVLEDGQPIYEAETITDGGVTEDSRASSRGRMDVTVVDANEDLTPSDADDLFAPYGNEIRVSRGIEFEDRIELVRLGVFRIDTMDADDSPNGLMIRLSGLDRSARVIDAKFEDPYQIASGTQAVDAIVDTFQLAWPDIPLGPIVDVDVELPALYAVEAEDRWVFGQGIGTALGCEVYFDRNGELAIQPVPSPLQGSPVAEFSEGEGGVLLGAGKSWDRSSARNRVIYVGQATDTATAPPRGVATDDNPLSPTYYYGSFGRVPEFSSSQFITTNDQAATAAAARLATLLGATQSIRSTTIEDPARKPSDIIRVNRPRLGVEAEDHVLDSVTHGLSASSQMAAATRVTQVLA